MGLIRKRLAVLIAVATAAAMSVPAIEASATSPTFFPTGFGLNGTAYTLRLAGADRFATAGTGALLTALDTQTKSGFPFNQGDGSKPALAYGAGACPGTVFIVASDGLPDALAASALRGLAAITLPDSSHTYNTSNALLLLTDTARPPTNATALNATTVATLTALKASCPGFDALILGGTSAVPAGVESALSSYVHTVGRIAGTDRYDTAGQIATLVNAAIGLGKPSFYASASDKGTAEPSTVFLADALTGADALAAGPVAADTNTPILLTNPAGLPTATQAALTALHPATIIALGGTAVIPDSVLSAAATAAGESSTPIRIAGPNRYATSVDLAEMLDDLWPANAKNGLGVDANAFSNQGFALARSEGSGGLHVGWPDALASALVLSSLHKNATVPTRLAPPVEANTGKVTLGGAAGPSRFPLLLTTAGSLPPEVDTYLRGLYPSPTRTASTAMTTDQGGFGFVFGGSSAVAPSVELSVAQDLSGGTYTTGAPRTDLAPALTTASVFYTAADFTNYVTDTEGDGGLDKLTAASGAGDKVCVARNGSSGAQFLDLYGTSGLASAPATAPYETSGPFPAGQSTPVCVSATGATSQLASLIGVSLSGQLSNAVPLTWSTASSLLRTTTPLAAPAPPTSPATSGPTALSDVYAAGPQASTLSLVYAGLPLGVTYKGTAFTTGTLTVTITRTPSGNPAVNDGIQCAGNLTEAGNTAGSTAFVANFPAAESATVPNGVASNVIACVGEYTIGGGAGGPTGGIKFTITGMSGSNTTAALSDLVVDGNA